MRWSGHARGLCLGALLWMALSFPALRAEEESGSWTNLAGRALRATPVAIQGKTVTFKPPDAAGKTMNVPLSAFPPLEQERLRVAVKDTSVPAGLQSAHAFATRVLTRARLLHADGQTSDEEYRQTVATTEAAFRAQAAPLIEQQKLAAGRLEFIVNKLVQNEE